MTEQEAIKIFKDLLDVPCEMLVKYDSVTNEEQKKALVRIRLAEEMAIKALEELKAYHEIGTVEECKDAVESIERFYQIGYNMAIDDYVERLKETYKPCKEADNYMYTNVCRRFDDIAQQLKAGDEDA